MGATDGEIGTVKEFYFDDHTWTIRYIIVEAGTWLSGRKVLISPAALLPFDWGKGIFPVKLTKEQIKNSPDIDTDKPVSRQMELELQQHYTYASYWDPSFYAGGILPSMLPVWPDNTNAVRKPDPIDDWHLRSTAQVTGYGIKANDGEIGKVTDFLIHPKTWAIDYLVVDTGHWLPGKKVIMCPKWIKEIQWEDSEITVAASIEQVKNSPEYEPGKPLNEEHEMHLHNYYNQFISNIQ